MPRVEPAFRLDSPFGPAAVRPKAIPETVGAGDFFTILFRHLLCRHTQGDLKMPRETPIAGL